MGRVPKFAGDGDSIDRSRKESEYIRQLRSRKRCHTETKTFLVPGAITTSLYVPPFWVGVDTDGNNPEYKTIYAFRGILRVGSVSVGWLVNGVQLGPDHAVTTVANEFESTINPDTFAAAYLNDGDIVQPMFTETSLDAADFSGSVNMLTQAA